MVAGRTHHPVWDASKCLPCGACRQGCPAYKDPDFHDEPDSLRGRTAREYPFPHRDGPQKVSPCVATCPLHQDVPGYLEAIAKGELEKARKIILETNPLPGVLSILCNRSCMGVCVRDVFDDSVDIRGLKAVPFADELVSDDELPGRTGDEQVVVVGSGPAGLAAASVIAREGIEVLVVERDDWAGGLLRYGVPGPELPSEVLDADIQRIAASGVTFETGITLDFPRELDALLASGVKAVVLAMGAPIGVMPETLGDEGRRGLYDVVAFMRDVNLGELDEVQGPAFIEGDGAPALAAARVAMMLGASPVHLVLSRPVETIAADAVTVRRAREEGVTILDSMRIASVGGDGQVDSVNLEGCEPVSAGGGRIVGRPSGETGKRPAALVVSAQARVPERDLIESLPEAKPTALGTLAVDPATMRPGAAGIFAAGEIVTGGRNIVEAVASGMRAGEAVLEYLEEK